MIGLALAACEKAVQIVYERNLRPPEKQHQPWLDRVQGQLLAAFGALEKAKCASRAGWFGGSRLMQPDITAAVAWRFAQFAVPEIVKAANFPAPCRAFRPRRNLPAFVETSF